MSFFSNSSWRSVLYVPADNPRALAKAETVGADAVIVDLEDAVAPEKKGLAREQAAVALSRSWPCPMFLRLNAAGTPWHGEDLEAALNLPISALVLPKVEDPRTLDQVPGHLPLWTMIETPLGVLRAADIAAHGRVAGLICGTNDLSRALRLRPTPGRAALLMALSTVILAARAHGKVPLDAVYNDVRDETGFAEECRQGRDLGFAGKTVIHPAQVEVANREYGVSEEGADRARGLLEAWEQARREGRSVATFAGALVEQMHVDEARDILAAYARGRRD